MIIKNGVTDEPIMAADLDMVSLNPKRIVCRYLGKHWDDVLYEAMKLAIESGAASDIYTNQYEEVVSDLDVHIGFSIQTKAIHPYADLHVTTAEGVHLVRRYYLKATDDVVRCILDDFFAKGCQGILPSFREHFTRFYALWKSSKNF